MTRRTKIVATLGPATDDPKVFRAMLEAGLNVVRLNFSHGSSADHKQRIEMCRAQAQTLGCELGILADMQGPKVRIGSFSGGPIQLKKDDVFALDASLPDAAGDQSIVGIDYKDLPNDVSVGSILLLDDGRVSMRVTKIKGRRIDCVVERGGTLSDHKGINLQGGGLSAGAITDKDRADIECAASWGVNWIALSFVRSPEDIQIAKEIIQSQNSRAGIISKIERIEALDDIENIVKASDGIMVARGDLAVEIGEEEVPGVQKKLIKMCREYSKPVITATQMMETMIHAKTPTRAEVSDVANAVLDGTDAVMLSAESAVGDHPVIVIQAVARICVGVEKYNTKESKQAWRGDGFERVDEAVAKAAIFTANRLNIRAMVALTESGNTPLWMSRVRTGIPIYGLSRHQISRGKMALYSGVYPINFDVTKLTRDQINTAAISEMKKRDLVQDGDLVILIKGDYIGVHGGSNAMKILKVGEIH